MIDRCKRNDPRAQSIVYERFAPTMFAVCMRYSHCRDDAQDTFQEAFIKAFQKIESFNGNGSFEGWLRRIMVNKCMDKFRKKKLTIVTDNPQFYQENEWEEEEVELPYDNDQLVEMISQLPEQYRLVFNMYVIEEYSHAEIAEQLNISVGTSKSNLSRAKTWLRKELKKKYNKSYIA